MTRPQKSWSWKEPRGCHRFPFTYSWTPPWSPALLSPQLGQPTPQVTAPLPLNVRRMLLSLQYLQLIPGVPSQLPLFLLHRILF
ncbi:hypothetical protein GDO81_023428 [Engystomops pustulosus]|uniref:Uncharacterized protein n=1 Tax=Engystomops pustulosus TaxID=76066 RepID=A0AAV6YS26_ENGPU|nr:hypothetical protein GDO81_023428 [Engystomops pustulosus]